MITISDFSTTGVATIYRLPIADPKADKVGKWLWYHKFKRDTVRIFVPNPLVSSQEISPTVSHYWKELL